MFVASDGIVFLDDLEYLTRANGVIVEHNLRLAHEAVPTDPVQLDELQFERFCAELLLG